MPVKSWAKKLLPAQMLYYGGKTAVAQYHKRRKQPFLDSLKREAPWTSKLPYELRDQYMFCDRQKGYQKLCIVLAGYKPQLWDSIFERIRKFLPGRIDVCVMTSGIRSHSLMDLCEKYGWSYLSTRQNKLTRIQNLAIYLHPHAQHIYKLDEDVFITEGYFDLLYQTYQQAENEIPYEIAFAAPLIPVNGYGYVRILRKCNLQKDWEERFGAAIYTDGKHHHSAILEQGAAARYMWGETQPVLRDLDRLSALFAAEPPSYTLCPIRFSIGAILFSRQAWLEWGLFPVDWTNGIGLDEEHLAHVCMFHGKAAVISENALAGHLAFGPQEQEMLSYFKERKIL